MSEQWIGFQKAVGGIVFNELVSYYGENVVLAGGAPRDWWFGNPATDLDFFIRIVNGKKHKDKFVVEKFGAIEKKKNPNYEGNPLLEKVYEVSYSGVKLNFIFINTEPIDVIKAFPVNVSMVWYNFNNDFHQFSYLNLFKIGVEMNALIDMETDTYKTNYYVDKIRNKFPGMDYYPSLESFVVGQGFDADDDIMT